MKIYVLHAAIHHLSPYMHNLKIQLEKQHVEVFIIKDLPPFTKVDKSILFFHRLRRFYHDMGSAINFINSVKELKKCGWIIAYTVDNFVTLDSKNPDLDIWVFEHFIHLADCIFTHNESMRLGLIKNYRVPSICHGYGANSWESYPLQDDLTSVEFANALTDKVVFTYIGNVRPYKDLEFICSHISMFKNAMFIIAGPIFQNYCLDLSPYKNVVVVDRFVQDTGWKTLASISDIFVCPYNIKSPGFEFGFFPSSLVQMAMYKKPILTPWCSSTEEILGANNAIYYEKDNIDQRLNWLFENLKIADKMGQRAYQYVKQKESWERIARTIVTQLNNYI